MNDEKENRRMTRAEIEELMRLKGWSRTMLAAQLDVTENTIHRWLMVGKGTRTPSGPASILMRIWLKEARSARKETVPA